MIYHLVTWAINREKAAEQWAFVQTLAARANEKFPAASVKLLENTTAGEEGGWLDTFPSYEAWEAANDELNQDEQYQAIWQEGEKNGLTAELTHTFYRVMGE